MEKSWGLQMYINIGICPLYLPGNMNSQTLWKLYECVLGKGSLISISALTQKEVEGQSTYLK